MNPIRFNLNCGTWDWEETRQNALLGDQLGFHSISIADHLYFIGGDRTATTPSLECYATLSAVTALTNRVRLLTSVTPIGFRNPALLAKIATTVDTISNGRLTLGLGTGALRQEYEAFDFPFPSAAERIRQLEDGIRLLKCMFTQDEPTYHGKYYRIDNGYCFPKPVQKPHPPILLGGSGKLLLQLAGREANAVNLVPPNEKGAFDASHLMGFQVIDIRDRISILREAAKAAGRDPEAIELSTFSYMFLSSDQVEADAMLAKIAASSKVERERIRHSMMVIGGTPQEVKRELRDRIEKVGITYFSFSFTTPEAVRLFAREVMPEFN
jgi:probable F420-dependent oxidoreductase